MTEQAVMINAQDEVTGRPVNIRLMVAGEQVSSDGETSPARFAAPCGFLPDEHKTATRDCTGAGARTSV